MVNQTLKLQIHWLVVSFLMLLCPFWPVFDSLCVGAPVVPDARPPLCCERPCAILLTRRLRPDESTGPEPTGPEPTGPEPRPTVQMWIRLLFICCSRCRLWRDARSCAFVFHFSARRGREQSVLNVSDWRALKVEQTAPCVDVLLASSMSYAIFPQRRAENRPLLEHTFGRLKHPTIFYCT